MDAVAALALAFSPDAKDGKTRCPVCGKRTLSLKAGDVVPVTGHCFGTCSQDRVNEAIFHKLAELGLSSDGDNNYKSKNIDNDDKRKWALEIWEQTQSAGGTLVQDYLSSRGIELPVPACLRFHPTLKHKATRTSPPAMVAKVTMPDGSFGGIQRTWLRRDGRGKAPIDPDKMTLGPIKGGAVRLTPLKKIKDVLAFGEGIETALSFRQLWEVPCWASLGANFLPDLILPPLPTAQRIIFIIDNDENGTSQRNAELAAAIFSEEGREVEFARTVVGKDINDILKEIRG